MDSNSVLEILTSNFFQSINNWTGDGFEDDKEAYIVVIAAYVKVMS